MANHGNTGQRYKLRKFVSAESESIQRVLVTLECGHSYVVTDGYLPWYQEQVQKGKKTRCLDCIPDQSDTSQWIKQEKKP